MTDRVNLTSIGQKKGTNARKIRKGRGSASGKGRSCGRGRGGSGHRAGVSEKVGFEGGQMPLVRRLPKRGFKNVMFSKVYEIVNISQLQEKFSSGDLVNPQKLKESGLTKGRHAVKILGKGELKKKIKIAGCSLSGTARKKIEEAGGEIDA